PDEFVGNTLVFEDHIGHLSQVFIKQRDQFHGIGALSQSGEITNVREENGELTLFAGQIDGVEIIEDIVDQSGGDVAIKCSAGTPQFASGGGVADGCG